MVAQLIDGLERFLGAFQGRRAGLKVALGQFDKLTTGFLDSFLVILFLDEGFGAIGGDENQADAEGEQQEGPAAGTGKTKLDEAAGVERFEMLGGSRR